MIDESRVQRMARKYEMNPDMARKLLEMARAQPAIVRLIRKYDNLREGDTVGNQDNQEASGRLPKDQEFNTSSGAGTSRHERGR